MFAKAYKLRQIRTQFDVEKLSELGKEMAENGQLGLKVEKGRLSVSSLHFLSNFTHLEAISIYGIARNLSVLSNMPNLRSVALCSLSTIDLKFLHKLKKLEELWLQGLRLKDWNSLRQLKQVKAITLFNLPQKDFDFLEEMESLQVIKLIRCSKVQRLPSLQKSYHLRRVILETVNRLEDLSGIAQAPNLEDIVVSEADCLSPKAFDCFLNHATIRSILPGIGFITSKKYNMVISRIPNELLMDGFYGTTNETFKIL